jgi:hypothetical protein
MKGSHFHHFECCTAPHESVIALWAAQRAVL